MRAKNDWKVSATKAIKHAIKIRFVVNKINQKQVLSIKTNTELKYFLDN